MVFTPKIIIYEFRYPMLVQDSTSTIGFHPEETLCGASVIRILCKIILRPNGFHPENNYIRGIGYLCLMQGPPPFGLLVFTPKRITLYMEFRQSMFFARFFFGLLVFTPKQSTVIYGNNHILVSWNFIWPSVLIGLRLLVYLKRVHRSVYPSSSSEEGSHRCIASEYHLEKWAQGSWSWAARSTLWYQFLIFSSRKRPSAHSSKGIRRPSVQSAEGNQSPIVRNAEGMESSFVWKAKVRA